MPTDLSEKESLKPTPAAEWGKKKSTKESFPVTLPSGNVVAMVRSLDLPVLLKSGRIPNPLAGMVQRMIDSGASTFNTNEMNSETLSQLLDMLHDTVLKCVIEPPFDAPRKKGRNEEGMLTTETDEEYHAYLEAWSPKEGHVSIFDMELEDKFFVFAVGQGAAADLESFREEQTAAMDAVPNVPKAGKPTKRVSKRK